MGSLQLTWVWGDAAANSPEDMIPSVRHRSRTSLSLTSCHLFTFLPNPHGCWHETSGCRYTALQCSLFDFHSRTKQSEPVVAPQISVAPHNTAIKTGWLRLEDLRRARMCPDLETHGRRAESVIGIELRASWVERYLRQVDVMPCGDHRYLRCLGPTQGHVV